MHLSVSRGLSRRAADRIMKTLSDPITGCHGSTAAAPAAVTTTVTLTVVPRPPRSLYDVDKDA